MNETIKNFIKEKILKEPVVKEDNKDVSEFVETINFKKVVLNYVRIIYVLVNGTFLISYLTLCYFLNMPYLAISCLIIMIALTIWYMIKNK